MPADKTTGFDSNVIIEDPLGTPAAPGPYYGFARTDPGVQSTGPRILAGVGNPNGVLTAPRGSLWIDSTTGTLYQNTDDLSAWSAVTVGGGAGPTIIQTTTLAAPAASITFAAIPQTYTDLLLQVSARSTVAAAADNLLMEYNADAVAANYQYQVFGAQNGGTIAPSSGTDRFTGATTGATAQAGAFGQNEILIPRYTSSNVKISNTTNFDGRSATFVSRLNWNHLWNNATAITQIRILPGTGPNFAAGTVARLLGVP